MKGEFLRFYVDENHTHQGVLLWEWLLQKANAMGLRGGSAFRAIGGFGRHHILHETRFFELAGSVGVEFMVDENEADQLLALVREQGVRIFFARIPADFGVIHPDAGDLVEAKPKNA